MLGYSAAYLLPEGSHISCHKFYLSTSKGFLPNSSLQTIALGLDLALCCHLALGALFFPLTMGYESCYGNQYRDTIPSTNTADGALFLPLQMGH